MSTTSIELETQLIEKTVSKRNDILVKAEEQSRRILEAAERERDRIKTESEKQIMNIIGSELRAIRDRIVGKADLVGRKMLMQAREEILSSLFDEAKSRLTSIADSRYGGVDYHEIIYRLLIETISSMGGEEFIISANERDLAYLRDNLEAVKNQVGGRMSELKMSLDEKAINAIGGVVVRNKEGDKVFHNTLESRLIKARRRTEAKVSEILGVI